MSSVHDEPEALNGILEECLEPVMAASGRTRDEKQLRRFNEEAFYRQSNRIPERLAELVEEESGGSHTVRIASTAIADNGVVFNGESHFVRCTSDTPEGEVTHPTSDMVLFIINGHTKRLFVNVPMRSQDDIDAEIERRRQQFLADREAERVRAENALVRREETQAEFDKLVSAIEWYVEKTESTEAKRKWQNMNSRHSQHHGAITLPDLLELCHLLGIDLATLVILSPITATASH